MNKIGIALLLALNLGLFASGCAITKKKPSVFSASSVEKSKQGVKFKKVLVFFGGTGVSLGSRHQQEELFEKYLKELNSPTEFARAHDITTQVAPSELIEAAKKNKFDAVLVAKRHRQKNPLIQESRVKSELLEAKSGVAVWKNETVAKGGSGYYVDSFVAKKTAQELKASGFFTGN